MIVYYTTCNQRLYEISCKGLIASFLLVCNSSDKLYVFHENINYDIISPNVVYIDVQNCEIYTSWFKKFKDIIPLKFGGTCIIENDKRLQYGNRFIKWNQKTCFWFWKIVATQLVRNYVNADIKYFILLDCDTTFTSNCNLDFYDRILPPHMSFGYHLGKFRRRVDHTGCAGVESGIIVFRNNTNAHAFIDDLMETYNNGKFLEYVRWDDGFVFRCLIGKEIHAPYCHDFVRKSGVKNVISEGPFKHKILHHIGKHLRLKINE